jgi:hypothetical protein
MATQHEQKEQIQTAPKISVGFCEFAAARKEIKVVGSSEKGAVFITVKVIISSLARSFFSLSRAIFCIALTASGVAALPIPNRFAATEAEISSFPFPVFQAVGKMRRKIGESKRERRSVNPLCRKTFKIPHQSPILPSTKRVTLTARWALCKMASDTTPKPHVAAPNAAAAKQKSENSVPIMIFSPFF